jgi:Asp-tRNA(Asn)/Glu-tRNA(Gln) amidotransferase A subunit family amidase
MSEELCFTPAVELIARIRRREVSPVEIMDAVLARIDRYDPMLNAFITVCGEQARAEARAAEAVLLKAGPDALGPLAGLPVSIKDLTPTAAVRTTYGATDYREHVPQVDAPIVTRVRKSGAILLGKTSTPAFGWLGVTENELVGTTNNPWALHCSPGGSSGGAGAAVAAGLGPLATGSDGGGSIRVPAALCGIVGLKPSQGRVPRGPESSLFETVDTLGPMTRTVVDAALLLSVIAGPVEEEPYMLPEYGVDYVADLRAAAVRGLRIALCPTLCGGPVDREVATCVEAAARHFETALGAHVSTIELDVADPIAYFLDYYPPVVRAFVESQPGFTAALCVRYPGCAAVVNANQEMPAHRWWQVISEARHKTYSALAAAFKTYDLLLTPTVPVPAWPHDRERCPAFIDGQAIEHRQIEAFRFTEPFGHSGHPAITLNCGFTQAGLPVGLQIVGRQRDDAGVLRAAAAYEASTQWLQRRPTFSRAPA